MEKSDNKKIQKNRKLRKKQLLWEDMSFSATEAYNLLRTNLTLSFPDEDGVARVIGVSSTEQAAGKSLTSINMAAALAKGGHKTLLLECDLRLPSIGKYLEIEKSVGISNFLTGTAELPDIIHPHVGYEALDVILCGQIPPNPSELLGSKRMAAVLQGLREEYEYIVLDFPPVGTVADALSLFRRLSGMVLVVRHDVTTKPELADIMHLLRSNNVKILGFVYNGVDPRNQKRYRKYAKSRYDYAHTSEAEAVQN